MDVSDIHFRLHQLNLIGAIAGSGCYTSLPTAATPKTQEVIVKDRQVALEIIKRSDKAKGFELLPRRWVSSGPLRGWEDAEAGKRLREIHRLGRSLDQHLHG
jgi:transposase